MSDLIRNYRVAKSHHESIPRSLEAKLVQLDAAFGHLSATAGGTEIVKAAKSYWPSHSPGTIKRNLVQLKAVLNLAADDGVIPRCPRIEMPYVNDTVYVDVTASEVNLLLDYIKWVEPRWYPLTLVLTNTGARLGEAMLITSSSFTRNGVVVRKPVNRRSKTIDRTVPLSSRMRADAEIVASCLARNGSLVPKGVAPQSVSTCLGRVIDSATAALGLPSLRVHDLRHAFAAMLAENGADLADLVSALGHSSTAMSMRYRGLVRTRLTEIMQRV